MRSLFHKLSPIVALVLLVVLGDVLGGVLGAPCLSIRLAHAAEKLVPAQFGSRVDKLGYSYTVDSNGRVRVPFGWLYSATSTNHGNVRFQQREMTANGEEFVLTGMLGQLELQRRLRVSPKLPGIRIVESLHNPTKTDITTTFVLYGQPNWPYQQILTDQGRTPTGPLTKKEGGIVCHMQQPMQLVVCFQLATPRARVKPTLVLMNNQQLQFHYQVTVPAGHRVSLAHGATVLPQSSMPGTKGLARLFRGMRRASWLQDLPKEIRTTLVNARSGPGFGDALPLPSLAAALDVEPGTVDRLAFGEETLLQGTATCERLTVAGAYGEAVLPFPLVAAIVGHRAQGRKPGVYLRDGQFLTGHITTDVLRFQMTSGMAIDLDVDKLDRLVMRASTPLVSDRADDAPANDAPEEDRENDREDPYFLFETFGGDRLRAKHGADVLHVATGWGEMRIPFSEIQRVHLAGPDTPGYWVWLVDGSRFRAYLRGTELEVATERFGTVQLPIAQILRILTIRPGPAKRDEEEYSSRCHLVLAGGAIVMGRIDLDALHFLSPAGIVPQPPSQIRVLRNEDAAGTAAATERLRFRADIWGGGHLTGELRELLVPVRTARGVLSIPVQDLREVHMPTPVVPLAVRTRLPGLIADLAHDLWEKREAASAALADLGELARAALNEALRETKDPEVERRVRRLLDRL